MTHLEGPLTESFRDAEPTLKKVARKFQYRYGGDLDLLTADSYYIFLQVCRKYDPSRSDFLKHVKYKVWTGLLDQHRRECKRKRILGERESEGLLPSRERFSVKNFTFGLSKESQQVVKLALEKKQPGFVVGALLELGWTMRQVLESFGEIREMLL